MRGVALRFRTTRRRENPIFETRHVERPARVLPDRGTRASMVGTALATRPLVSHAFGHRHTVLSQSTVVRFPRPHPATGVATARAGPRTNV